MPFGKCKLVEAFGFYLSPLKSVVFSYFYTFGAVHVCICNLLIVFNISDMFLIPITRTGLSIDEFSRKKLDATGEELSEEKALAYSCLS